MSPEDYVRLAAERMSADGAALLEAALPSGPVLAGHHRRFRLRWGKRVDLFALVAPALQASVPALTIVTAEAVDWAERARGGIRGLQRGVVVVPVLVTSDVLPEARAAAEARPDRAYAALTLPTVVDLAAGRIHTYAGPLAASYAPWVRARLHAALPDPPPAGEDSAAAGS